MVPRARKAVVAIDGPAAAGKSTVARCLADRLEYRYVSSGLLYRVATAVALRECRDPADETAVATALAAADLAADRHGVTAAGSSVGGEMLHGGEVARWLPVHTAMRTVRLHINALLHAAATERPCVIEGRDIGTVVFPDAETKVFLDASPAVRARRRQREQGGDLQAIADAIAARDTDDRGKAWGRLAQAADAVLVDTTDLTARVVCDRLDEIVRCRA